MNCSYSNSALRTTYPALFAALLVGVPASSTSAQEPPEPTVLELSACEERCGLTLVPVVEFGEDAGPGMIEGEVGGWVDSSGRMYLVALGADHVLVFDSDGTFLRRVGRRGEGPGELLDIRAFAVVDDGVFAVLDSGRGVILTFDWTGKLLREVRTRGWAPVGTGVWLVPLGDAFAVYQAGMGRGFRQR